MENKYLYTDGENIYYVQRLDSIRQKYKITKEIPTSPLTTRLHQVTNKTFNTTEEAQAWLDNYAKYKDLEPCLPY